MTTNTPSTRPVHTVAEILAQDKSSIFALTPSLIHLYAILAPACLVVCATNEQFGSPKGALLGITSASYPLGAIISTPFSAYIPDRFGRRLCITIGSLIMVIGVIVQCASTYRNVHWRTYHRWLRLALAAAPVLISELAHPRHRVLPGSLYNTGLYLGALLAGWVAFGSYRIPSAWA
ncbi:hypothetical protein FVER53590_29007 [Fusarium verticillioides]|nr:hypothetical protein FVER53590_29007 [Fusarium verticillioides]